MTSDLNPRGGDIGPEHETNLPSDESAALGGLDFGALLGMAQSMQEQMADSADRLAATIVEGQSGGGVVTVSVTGGFRFQSVSIRPEAIDPDDPTMLEDLVLAALRDAVTKVDALQNSASPLAGLDLGGLGGLLGGA